MQYKNYVVISDADHGGEYVRDTFNEGYSTADYEIIDVDLAATDISRKIVDKLNKKDKIYDKEVDSAIFMNVDEYIDDIRNKLIENVEELVNNNLECEILNYKGDE